MSNTYWLDHEVHREDLVSRIPHEDLRYLRETLTLLHGFHELLGA